MADMRLGMPIAAQVAGLPWEEETVLRIMRDIERGVSA
jgi:Asp-tRNA(Asn)/Glu-tRNA(Gln) amidotransferase A subunit family amidase